jgi:uncharacterized membrane protein
MLYHPPAMPRWLFALTFLTALGAGVIGGVFYAFSTFVMRALRRRPAAEPVAAMQAINVTVITPAFLGLFLGGAAAAAALVVRALLRWHALDSAWLLTGGLLYLAGTFGVTMLFNVPLNNAIAAVEPASAEGATVWSSYLTNWTLWNTVRTVASALALIAFILGLVNKE